jgi:hypothetical protein
VWFNLGCNMPAGCDMPEMSYSQDCDNLEWSAELQLRILSSSLYMCSGVCAYCLIAVFLPSMLVHKMQVGGSLGHVNFDLVRCNCGTNSAG